MKTLFTLILGLLSFAGKAQLEIKHLTGDFYIYTTYHDFEGTAFPSNSMYLLTSEGAVLFDTPWDSVQFQPILDSIKARHDKEVIMCISTHFHADRTAGLGYYKNKGIRTYSSGQTFELCQQHNEKTAEYRFTKDTVFSIGSYTFETFYPGKGHAPDNIVIWFPKEKILYGGCFVKSTDGQSLGNLSDADIPEWSKSVKKTLKRFPSPQYVIPGHFGWADNKSLQHTLKLLQASKK